MRKRPLCLICIGLMMAIWMMKLAGLPVFGEPAMASWINEYLKDHETVYIAGIVSERAEKPNSTQYYLKNSYLLYRQKKIPIHKILLVTQIEEKFHIGASVEAAGSLSELRPPGNPGEFDSSAYYACQGIYYSMWGEEIRLTGEAEFSIGEIFLQLREKITEGLFQITDPETAGTLAAMVFGDREAVTEATDISYRISGITHILSVSGLHFSMLGNGLLRLFLRLRMRQPVAAGIAAFLMGGYCLLSGGQAAAVRAFIMYGVMLGARLLQKSYDLLSSLSLAAILLLLYRPGYLFYSGFQLSFAAVLGVGVLYPVLRRLFLKENRRMKNRFLKYLAEGIFSWIAVTAVTQPLVCFWFYEIPVWSLPVNLMMLPAVNPVMVSGLAGGAAAVFPPLGKILVFPAALCLKGYQWITDAVRTMPGACWICGQPEIWQIVFFYLAIASCLFLTKEHMSQERRRKKKRRIKQTAGIILLIMACIVLFWRKSPEFSITALDVGQGDCLVIRKENGLCYLVDGGSSSEKNVGQYRILPYLKQQGIGNVEGIFISHPDADHMNGILEILDMIAENKTSLTVKKIFLPEWMAGCEEETPILESAGEAGAAVFYLNQGDAITADELRIKVLFPPEGAEVSGNGGSLAILVTYGDFDGLLTGDLEGEGELTAARLAGKCDYLKVAHHGSQNSTGERFLKEIAPRVAVISAPENSIYGHPHPDVLERIEAAGGDWYQTGFEGAVTAEIQNGRLLVKGYRRNIAIDPKVVYTE